MLTDIEMEEKLKQMNEILDNMTIAQRKGWVPKNTKEATKSPLYIGFIQAIKVELDALNEMGLWKTEKLPERMIPINTRFVYDVKWNIKENCFSRLKARLIAQGFRQ